MGWKKKTVNIYIIFFLFLPISIKAQLATSSQETQQLWLQLSLNYYTVVKEGQVDQDSSLALVSKIGKISRWPIITEGFGQFFSTTSKQWVDNNNTFLANKELAKLKGVDHIKLLVLLGAFYAFEPGFKKKNIDSAQYFLSKARKESGALHSEFWLNQSMCLLGKNYFKNNQVKEGVACFTNIINNSKTAGNHEMEAKAWDYEGTYCPPSANTISLKLRSLMKANELYKQINNTPKQINTLMNIAYLSFVLQDINNAENNALAALKLQNSIKFNFTQYTSDFLGLIYDVKGNTAKHLNFAVKAVNTAIANRDSLGLGYFYKRVGDVTFGSNAYNTSAYWLKKSVDEFSKNKDLSLYRALHALTFALAQLGKNQEAISLTEKYLKMYPPINITDKEDAIFTIADNYTAIKNYPLAEKYYLAAEKISKGDPLITKGIHSSYLNYKMGVFYLKSQHLEKAKTYLTSFLKTRSNSNIGPIYYKDTYLNLYRIDSISGNYTSALSNLKQYLILYQSINDVNQAKLVENLKVKYLTLQKEKDIELLQKESDFQKKHADFIKKTMIAGFAASLLIITMLYNRYHINKKQKNDIDKKNNLLQRFISEKDELLLSKEMLLKEVHHRVKNNLHIVICLLESQAVYLDSDALKAIENCQHRIYAMSLIHQKLYQSPDIKSVDMSVYLPEFIGYLKDSFVTDNRIRFELYIEILNMGVSHAVPLSLIINEAVTNSIKYAFPGSRIGTITISMYKFKEQVILTIADNGIGFKTDTVNTLPETLGLKLLKGLCEDIRAESSIENDSGTKITIKFNIDSLVHIIDQ